MLAPYRSRGAGQTNSPEIVPVDSRAHKRRWGACFGAADTDEAAIRSGKGEVGDDLDQGELHVPASG